MNKCDSECRSYFKFIFMHQLEWRKWFGKFMLWILKIANCKQFIAHSPCPCACRSFSAGHSIILRWFHSSVVLLCCWYGLTIRSTNKQNTIIYSFLFIGFGFFCFFLCVRFLTAFQVVLVILFSAQVVWICMKCDTMSFLWNTLIKCDVWVLYQPKIYAEMYLHCKRNKMTRRCFCTTSFSFLFAYWWHSLPFFTKK